MFWSIYSFSRRIAPVRILSKLISKKFPDIPFPLWDINYYPCVMRLCTILLGSTLFNTLSLLTRVLFGIYLHEILVGKNTFFSIVLFVAFVCILIYLTGYLNIYDDEKYEKVYERVPAAAKKKWGWITLLAIILVLCYNALCVWLITKLQH